MRRIITLLIIMLLTLAGTAAAANYTMSWDFEVFNNPDARQVALNLANTQDSLIEEEEDALERFKEGLERRLYSAAQRSLVDMILGEEEVSEGQFPVGNLIVTIDEDDVTGEVTIIIEDTETGETTFISYSPDDYIYW